MSLGYSHSILDLFHVAFFYTMVDLYLWAEQNYEKHYKNSTQTMRVKPIQPKHEMVYLKKKKARLV